MMQRNWQTCMFLIIIVVFNASGSSSISLADSTPGTVQFCVADTNADLGALQSGLNWACGLGGANCNAIQPGQPCYEANNLPALASYAYNDYYQRRRANGGTCDFSNTAALTSNDPSHGSCIFMGSTRAGITIGGGGTNANSSGGVGNTFPNDPSFGPSPFDISASKMKFSKLGYLVIQIAWLTF